MNPGDQQKLQATWQILRECSIEGAVEMLDELAANRGFKATKAGRYLALQEEDANCQFAIHDKPAKTLADLHEKIEAMEYALGALKTFREIRRMGVEPAFGPPTS